MLRRGALPAPCPPDSFPTGPGDAAWEAARLSKILPSKFLSSDIWRILAILNGERRGFESIPERTFERLTSAYRRVVDFRADENPLKWVEARYGLSPSIAVSAPIQARYGFSPSIAVSAFNHIYQVERGWQCTFRRCICSTYFAMLRVRGAPEKQCAACRAKKASRKTAKSRAAAAAAAAADVKVIAQLLKTRFCGELNVKDRFYSVHVGKRPHHQELGKTTNPHTILKKILVTDPVTRSLFAREARINKALAETRSRYL